MASPTGSFPERHGCRIPVAGREPAIQVGRRVAKERSVGTGEVVQAGHQGYGVVARGRVGVWGVEVVGCLSVAEIPKRVVALVSRSVGMKAVIGDRAFIQEEDLIGATTDRGAASRQGETKFGVGEEVEPAGGVPDKSDMAAQFPSPRGNVYGLVMRNGVARVVKPEPFVVEPARGGISNQWSCLV